MANYTINFAPIGLQGKTHVLIGRQPYQNERLEELRKEFWKTHVFRRERAEDVIIDIPITAGQGPLGSIQEEADLAKTPWLWPPLLSAALVRAFSGNRDILFEEPVAVIGAVQRGLVKHQDLPEWIQKRTLLKFETRWIYRSHDKRTLGLVCETRLKNLILGTCADLMAVGVSVIGRYVQVETDPKDARLMKPRVLVGRVVAVEGDVLILEDHKDGFESVSAARAFLEARREIFDDCVSQILGASASKVLDNAAAEAAALHSGPGRKKQIDDAFSYLREKAALEGVPGAKFTLGPMLCSGSPEFPAVEMIPKPLLVFDPSGTRKDDWNERGLKKNGPYDQRTFSPKRLRIAVVCQGKHEGQVDRFVARFLDGMPETLTGGKHKKARYGDGFLRRFCLEKPSVAFFTAESANALHYLAASRRALAQATDEGFKWDLALIQVEEEFKSFDDGSNPYYATKSAFLKRDVPVQSVRLETMAQPDTQLVFSMNHMSLATYAKRLIPLTQVHLHVVCGSDRRRDFCAPRAHV